MIDLQATYVEAPTPHVRLDVGLMPEGTAAVSVQRIVGAYQAPVRGHDPAPVYGIATAIVDWDAPLGRQATYVCRALDGAGGVLSTASIAVTTGTIGASEAWITNPLDPISGMRVTLMEGSDDTTEFPQKVTLSTAAWSSGLPSAIVETRQRGANRTLVVRLDSLEKAKTLEDLLSTSAFLLVRAPGIRHRSGALYVVVENVTETRERDLTDSPTFAETTWTLECAEVGPGRMPVTVAPWSYQDSMDFAAAHGGSTYATRLSLWPMYIDMRRQGV